MFDYYKIIGGFMILIGLGSVVGVFMASFGLLDLEIGVPPLFGFLFGICVTVGIFLITLNLDKNSKEKIVKFAGMIFFIIGLISILINIAGIFKIFSIEDSTAAALWLIFLLSTIAGVLGIMIAEKKIKIW